MEPFVANEVILALADRQHGQVTHAQLLQLGLGRGAIRHRVASGRLFRGHHAVYSVDRHRTRRGRWMAAVLACGEGAVLCGPSAGAVHGLVRGDGPAVHIAVTGTGGRGRRDGIRVHRTALEPWEVTAVDGIPMVTAARALLDLSAGATPARIARLVDRCEQLRLYDDRQVRACLAAHARLPGAARLRRALAAYEEPPALKNELEAAMFAIAAAAGLPRPSVNTPVEGFEADFFWARQRLIVETDGRGTHLTRSAFERDRARDVHHTTLGYRVLRFTHRQVIGDPQWVTAVLRRLLEPTA